MVRRKGCERSFSDHVTGKGGYENIFNTPIYSLDTVPYKIM
jgi:hypothetical protein